MATLKNKRQFTRVDACVKVETKIGDAILANGITRNISANGVFIECSHSLTANIDIKIALFLSDNAPGNAIDITGTIVRAEPKGIAVQFKKMQIDDLAQLKRIIMMNTAEAQLVEKEFSHIASCVT